MVLAAGLLQIPDGQLPVTSAVTVRPMVVYQTPGAPVVIEQTDTVDGRLHGRVRIRNVSDRPISGITFVVTIGPLPGAADTEAVRLAEVGEVALRPGATGAVTLRGIAPADTDRLVPLTTDRVAELGILEVTFASGASWRSLQKPGWLARPDLPVRLSCVDASLNTRTVGEMVAGPDVQECRADGVLVKRPVAQK
jgi:hypothetical protein